MDTRDRNSVVAHQASQFWTLDTLHRGIDYDVEAPFHFVQIVVGPSSVADRPGNLYVLGSDGVVYLFSRTAKCWVPLPMDVHEPGSPRTSRSRSTFPGEVKA